MRTYPGDPYWLLARHKGRCDGCGVNFPAGSMIFRYKTRVYADKCGCGQAHDRDFQAAAQDESVISGRW